ncbi:MAG: LTA synthase family protein [Bergeyella zoohelcum]|nr:LTA synthase family protein [Bergeyella zoohelcum]
MKTLDNFRWNDIKTLIYRLILVYTFYQIARFLFWFFNQNLFHIESVSSYLKLAYHGFAFDTTAILYVNSLFILLSILPLLINTHKSYQAVLFWVYFITNGISYGLNFIDFAYFPFSKARLTTAAFDVMEHESNLSQVFIATITEQPLVPISYLLLMGLWVFLYKKIRVKDISITNKTQYFVASFVWLCIVTTLVVGGIRGDFKHSTRPINMVDAAKHIGNRPENANIVLNSVFSFFRTINTNSFKEVRFVEQNIIDNQLKPYKLYKRDNTNKPNVVILIVESLGREYCGTFNQGKNIKNYESFTPFLDSLAQESLIFPNAYANGRQSIHGMSSVLAGIPSLADAFTSSPYANQNIQSIVSITKEMGYETSFYHGAPNGSMGFQGFAGILGFDHYFGKTEYNNDADFDGIWAIWDEPFLQYFAKNNGKKQPFFSVVFTASSHHPFKVPKQYENTFRKGFVEIHKPVQYTDFSLKRYFETAQKQDWYKNTIFVITADHTNQNHYPLFSQGVNRFAVPILFYSPNPKYQLKGINEQFAQQMDIYPTLADLLGYNQPIRSWGKSLVRNDENTPHLIVTSDGSVHHFIIKNYIYSFDGQQIIGIYKSEDTAMQHNLIHQLPANAETIIVQNISK